MARLGVVVLPVLRRGRGVLGRDFDEIDPSIVGEVLTWLLGETASSIVFRYIEDKYSLNLENLSRHPDKLFAALQELFGSGAEVIEKEIIRHVARGLTPVSDRLSARKVLST